MGKQKTLLKATAMLFALGSFISATAQGYETELLRNYQLPEIKRHSLDFNFNSSGSFNNTSYKLRDEDSSKNKSSFIGGDVSGTYTYYKNTHNFIGKQSLSIGFSGNYSKQEFSKNEYYNQEAGNINPTLSYKNLSRFYFSGLFLETGGTASIEYGRNYGDSYDYNTDNYFQIPLSVGVGRIQNVEDMRQAIYIMDKFRKKGLVKKDLGYNSLYELAELISTVKNKRFLDSRKKMISEISSIDSFLVKNNIIENNGAEYFTTLYDYWMYGALFERKSGTEWKVGFVPSYRYQQQKDDSYWFKQKYDYLNLMGNLSFTYERPANLYWQHSAFADINAGVQKIWSRDFHRNQDYENSDYSKTKNSHQVRVAHMNVGYLAGYYPNSRTHLEIGITESFSHQNFKEKEREEDKYNSSYTALKFNTYYYLSPQFRIAANSSLGYHHSFNKDHNFEPLYSSTQNLWVGNFSITLTYSLF